MAENEIINDNVIPDNIAIDEENRNFAVNARNCNILLSAAAGSGKTFTLVERIVKRLLEDEPPVSVDKLLVVTFTNAAAAELRQRIDKKLTEEFNKAIGAGDKVKAENAYRQKLLLPKATIGTIDAFCLDVVKKNFVTAGIDPVFSIDDKEVEIITESVMNDVLEKYYALPESEEYKVLRDIVDIICNISSDDDLKKEILTPVYKYVRNFENPEEWLLKTAENYAGGEVWIDYISGRIVKTCEEIIEHITLLIGCINGSARPDAGDTQNYYMNLPFSEKYIDFLSVEKAAYEKIAEQLKADKKAIFKDIFEYVKPSAPSSNAKAYKDDPDAKIAHSLVYAERDRWRRYYTNLKKKLLPWFTEKDHTVVTPEYAELTFKRGIEAMARYVKVVCKIVGEVISGTREKMRDRRVYSFSEIAHMAFDILQDDTVAASYRAAFDELYIDEYQDTSALQERILRRISRLDEGSDNMFMVGDVKQSIYGFRYAKPDYFIEKYNLYSENPEKGALKVLTRNFRSRKTVLDAVNVIFAAIMRKGVCEIEYTEDVYLNYGAKEQYEGNPLIDPKHGKAELIYFENLPNKSDPPISLIRREYGDEALFIVHKIISLFEEGFEVCEKDKDGKGFMRPLRFSDIAIVARVNKAVNSITKALSDFGLPVEALASECLLERPEVCTVLDFLRIIDNPRQDYPLVAVLRSAYYNFTDEMLAKIKAASMDVSGAYDFYGALSAVMGGRVTVDNEITAKIKAFMDDLAFFREIARVETLSRLVWAIINHNGFYQKGGTREQGNLRVLLEITYPYDSGDKAGLYNFLGYINSLIEMESKTPEAYADASAENDKIKVMTIHKSKGLEFPVLFIYDANHVMDKSRSKIYFDETLGMGFDFIFDNSGSRFIKTSAALSALSDTTARRELAEEQRMLYVAMTRAREKMYITASLPKKPSGSLSYDNMELFASGCTPLQTNIGARTAKSYLEMLAQGIFTKESSEIWDISRGDPEGVLEALDGGKAKSRLDAIFAVSNEALNGALGEALAETKCALGQESSAKVADLAIEASTTENEAIAALNAKLEALDEGRLPAKLSVSSVKRMLQSDDEFTPPSHAKTTLRHLAGAEKADCKLTPTEFGTLMHKCMQLLLKERKAWPITPCDETVISDYTEAFLESLRKKNLLTDNELKQADRAILTRFLTSDRAVAIKEAEFACSEVAFTHLADLSLLQDGLGGKIALQGVIDLYYQDGDGIALVDFKTDRITDANADKLCADYTVQLKCYVNALQSITGKRVTKAVLLFLRTGREFVARV